MMVTLKDLIDSINEQFDIWLENKNPIMLNNARYLIGKQIDKVCQNGDYAFYCKGTDAFIFNKHFTLRRKNCRNRIGVNFNSIYKITPGYDVTEETLNLSLNDLIEQHNNNIDISNKRAEEKNAKKTEKFLKELEKYHMDLLDYLKLEKLYEDYSSIGQCSLNQRKLIKIKETS